ncbi:MAG TPA: dihydroorotate dehydrogenase, partial [Desulfonauticus sp.]|nr:dihydroorotate dehydrogenase [Desulfonauticus sp.]
MSVDLRVNLSSLNLKNPLLSASGTFGYGLEFAPYGDLKTLGG